MYAGGPLGLTTTEGIAVGWDDAAGSDLLLACVCPLLEAVVPTLLEAVAPPLLETDVRAGTAFQDSAIVSGGHYP